MITSWDIYWITRLDSVGGFFVAASTTLGLGVVILCIIRLVIGKPYFDGEKKFIEKWPMTIAIISPLALLFMIMALVTPTTKEAVAIYLIPKIVNNEQAQKLPDNAMKLLNGKLEEWISDMAGKEKNK